MRTSLFSISAIFLTLVFTTIFVPKSFSAELNASTELVEEVSSEEGHSAEVVN